LVVVLNAEELQWHLICCFNCCSIQSGTLW